MSSQFEIDYDAEAVWLDEAWFTRDELAHRIKQLIEGGDYRLARPSAALEALEGAMGHARVVAARVSPEMAAAVEKAADRAGRPVGAVLREALGEWLGRQAAGAGEEKPASAEGAEGEADVVGAGPSAGAADGDFPVVEEHVPLDDPEMEKSLLAR